jgi:GT2 family glycosyltransferase/glycosyltransferase involved in cell wall biosynthesis/predicted SAM-dependent methyltransferase
MKVNLGCGHSYIEGWVNVDAADDVVADVRMDAFEFVRDYGDEIDELYMGHFLEHLLPASASALLSLIGDSLPEGARVSAVVPDMRAIFAAYDAGEISNAELNERFVYSYSQPSPHVWCYDIDSLLQVFEDAGYRDVEPIDPVTWEPVFWKTGPESRWQCGVRATVPAAGRPRVAPAPAVARDEPADATQPATADEVLLHRIRTLRAEIEELRRNAPAAGGDAVAEAPSMFDRLPAPLVPAARAFLRDGTVQRSLARFGIDAARGTRSYLNGLAYEWQRVGLLAGRHPSYITWRRHNVAGRRMQAEQRRISRRAWEPVAVECIVLGYEGTAVEKTLRSVVAQSWEHWHVTAIGGARTAAAVTALRDERITARSSTEANLWREAHVALAHEPTRDFVVFVAGGDVLAPDCFFEIAWRGGRDPSVDLVYWDDDIVDPVVGGKDPQFRPSWSPDYLLGTDYVGTSFAVRHRRVLACGLLGPELGEARTWDMILRCALLPEHVERVPRVLSHVVRRLQPRPDDAIATVSNELARRGCGATATFERGAVRVLWPDDLTPKVSIVIATRHNRALVEPCLRSLAALDYPAFEVIVVDNGERTDDNEAWYEASFTELDLRVEWWTRPFNYSRVNNHGASLATGEVLLFLNDDTEMADRRALRELAAWAVQPGVGLVGAQLVDGEGAIQHGGVILGLNGFADHLFQGMRPDSESLLGPTTSYRDVLSVTAACVAVRRATFEELGGFDERFELCGSDVALGLDAVLAGYRNLCTPFAGVRHFESATRGTDIPDRDFFASYWRYQRWVSGGDPYFSPNLSIASREPALRGTHERTVAERMSATLGREIKVFRMQSDAAEAAMLATTFRATDADVRAVVATHAAHREPRPPKTVNWFLPDLDSPFYGGVNTVLRLADHLSRTNGVESRFVFWAAPNEPFFRSAIAAAFPNLAGAPISFHDASLPALAEVPEADVAVATLWATAYSVAHFPNASRKFYLIQDFEPMFYPAGTLYALAEESYHLGLYGICNTEHMLQLYESRYGGRGTSFQPAVDTSVFHAEGRPFDRTTDGVATVFVYARPGHWRNCWELASIALEEVKERLGDRVRIVTAGSWARPDDVGTGIEHLGLLDYRETGNLYRRCDVGVALTVSEHPSYLPLELMACGVPIVAFDNPAGYWALRHGENSLLARRTVDSLRDAIERVVLDPELGRSLSRGGLRTIAESHASWDKAFAGIYEFLGDPEGAIGKH